MFRRRCCVIALLVAVAACSDRDTPTSPTGSSAPAPSPAALTPSAIGEREARERLAQRLALALADPAFRASVKAQIEGSTVREHKVHFRKFLEGNGSSALHSLARVSRDVESNIEADAAKSVPLELYFPVPEHRTRWDGGPDLLVATEREDGEAPVAFDTYGRRQVLSATRPPATPVLALVPVETNFDAPAAPFVCCAGGGGTTSPSGLYMTASHFVQDFEGWLKGNSEYEVHILGQSGQTDSLTSYQCAGEHAGGYYAFDQNDLDWTGSVLLFTQQQLDSYKSQHPNQNFRVLAIEDDDGACAIRMDNSRFKSFITVLQNSYPNLTGGKDTTTSGLGKIVKRANALQKILRAAYSFITSQDDLIGNAVEDVVTGEFHTGFNWIVKGESNVTNGWIKLQMK